MSESSFPLSPSERIRLEEVAQLRELRKVLWLLLKANGPIALSLEQMHAYPGDDWAWLD